MEDSKEMSNQYFAARPPDKATAAVLGKATTFYTQIRANAYVQKLANMWRFYYGNFNQGASEQHSITFAGEQGELTHMPVNIFRNLARHIINIITAQRPTLESAAINTDYKSLSQTYLANGILDYYMREKGLENRVFEAVEMATVMGSSFIEMEWNATAGESFDFDQETGEYNYTGELEFTLYDPLSVVVDGTKTNYDDQEWVLLRSFENRYNLIAKYPEYKDKIMGIPAKHELYGYRIATFSNDETDDIPIFKFYHKKTEAMPEGRYMLFISSDIVLLDLPIPYRTLPVFRLAPASIMGTPYGYSDMFDIYPLQEALNQTASTIMTNQTAFGVQNLFVKRGADLTMESLPGQLNIVEGNEEPKPLQLTATSPETFKMLDIINQMAETQSGINSVTRGNPEASLRSGNSLALVQSMSLQFQSSFQRNYIKFLEELGSSLIEILKDFATTPKMIAIVGKNKRPLLKEFTGDMISDIRRVTVNVGNALSHTIAGRVEIANNLAQMHLIKTPEQYFEVMETGRVDVMYEGDMMDLLLIKKENEYLMEGREIFADPLDRHAMHILEHRVVMSDPDLRMNPELAGKVRAHIQEHIDMLRTVNPDILMLIKEQPLNPEQLQNNPNLPPGPMNPPPQGQPQGMPPSGSPPPGQAEQSMPAFNNQHVLQQSSIGKVMNPALGGAGSAPTASIPEQPSVPKGLLPAPNMEPRAK